MLRSATPTTLDCVHGALLSTMMCLDGVFAAARARQPPSVAAGWLQRHASSAALRNVPASARVVSDLYLASEPDAQQVC